MLLPCFLSWEIISLSSASRELGAALNVMRIFCNLSSHEKEFLLRKSEHCFKFSCFILHMLSIQGDPYGRGIVYVDSKFEVAFSCKVGLLPRPVTEL